MFIIKINKSCIVTYLGIIFGILSIYFSFTKIAFQNIPYVRYSFIFLILSGICDMFDGKVARMCKRTEEEKAFGIELDSLADTFNFIAVPVVIMLSLGMNSIISCIIFALFVLCGISRLAFFDINADLDNPVKYYSGLPVTSTAIIYPVLGILHGIVSNVIFTNILLGATLITSFLFVYKFKCPKLKGKSYIFIPILALLLIIFLLVIR